MKTTATFLAGLLFAGSATIAGEQTGPANDPDSAAPALPGSVHDSGALPGSVHDSGAGQIPAEAPEQPVETIEVEKGDLIRKVVITVEGDEIGVIRDVGYMTATGEPVAIVDVDAYIGIGEKRIAIPLSRFDWSATDSDSVTTVLTRQGVETAREVGESDFSPLE